MTVFILGISLWIVLVGLLLIIFRATPVAKEDWNSLYDNPENEDNNSETD